MLKGSLSSVAKLTDANPNVLETRAGTKSIKRQKIFEKPECRATKKRNHFNTFKKVSWVLHGKQSKADKQILFVEIWPKILMELQVIGL